jgi:hypothetical protein
LSAWAQTPTQAQILFEGYSKISQDGQFIGYVVQRYEFEPFSKQFVATSFIKYNEVAGSLTESLKAFANEALEPVSYVYNRLSPKLGVLTIEAKNQNGTLMITQREGGKTNKRQKAIPKGAFFSSFLAYVILKNPHGFKTNSQYEYQAIAEEEGEIYSGVALVQNEESYKGIPVFKVENKYPIENKIPRDVSLTYATAKGEMLLTTAPQRLMAIELMAEPAKATGGLVVSAENLKLLFGSIPEGKVNALAAATSAPPSGAMGKSSGAPTEAMKTTAEAVSNPAVKVSKPTALESMELQEPPVTDPPRKQGTRKGKGILTKPK